ncbi:reverse transcriptase [Lasius niger]|uniref:Reverse transcriptase n=1 Tax=Lasius niger TaxID=67767 RepID=A0A0J7KN01_LASNI|nr:reverse transcriptase [Lasius niger]
MIGKEGRIKRTTEGDSKVKMNDIESARSRNRSKSNEKEKEERERSTNRMKDKEGIRKAMNGGILTEIPGKNGAAESSSLDELVNKIQEVLDQGNVKATVKRPTVIGEIRVFGFDESASEEDISRETAEVDKCLEKDIDIGTIRRMFNGLYMVWGAQDLMRQTMLKEDIGICAVAEPIRVPKTPFWFSSLDEKATWTWRPDGLAGSCSLITRSNRFVAIKYGELCLISFYVSPNATINEFLEALDELGDMIRTNNRRTVVCGDFNSWSVMWGSRSTNQRGQYVEDWAAEFDLRVVNIGNAPTCVRHQGESIVDLTWATPDLIDEIMD